jgi:predicted esterase
MNRTAVVAACVLALVSTVLSAPAARSSPPGGRRLGVGPAGAVVRTGTAWTVTDELFDATGPDLDELNPSTVDPLRAPPGEDVAIAASTGVFGSQRATAGGDFWLPTDRDRWPDFTADIAGIRVELRGSSVDVTVRFTSMPHPTSQLATVAFASAASPGSARPWPAGAGVESRWQTALTIAGDRTTVVRADGAQTSVVTSAEDHLLRAVVPLAALPPRPWAVTAGAGLADPADPSRYWAVPVGAPLPDQPGARGPTTVAVWDVIGLRADRRPSSERDQARLLAAREVSASVEIGGSAPSRGNEPGTSTRNFESRWDGGDGVTRDPSGVAELGPPPVEVPVADPGPATGWTFTGALQHYGIHVPPGYRDDADAPLLVYLHGSGGDVGELFGAFPDLVHELSVRGFLIATPLGRGDTFYRPGPGELDVLEAIADVRANYRVDADRIFLLGFSGGAAGVNVLTSRHPDLFAGAISVAATFEEPSLVDNIAALPWLGVMADGDPVSQALDAPGLYQALSDRGGDATLIRYAAKTHEFSLLYDSIPAVLDLLTRSRRDHAPPRVTWVIKPGDARPGLGLDRGGAWWLDDVTAADPSVIARVEVRSFATGRGPSDPALSSRTESVSAGDGRSGRAMARIFTTRPAVTSTEATNRLDVEATNVRRLRVDLAATGLTTDKALTVTVSTDHEMTLALVDGERSHVTVTVAPGSHTLHVVR